MRIPESREGRIGCLLALAMVAAPFVALLFGVPAAMAVLAAGAGATAFLAFSTSRIAEPERKASLLMAAIINAVFALIAVWILLSRVF